MPFHRLNWKCIICSKLWLRRKRKKKRVRMRTPRDTTPVVTTRLLYKHLFGNRASYLPKVKTFLVSVSFTRDKMMNLHACRLISHKLCKQIANINFFHYFRNHLFTDNYFFNNRWQHFHLHFIFILYVFH